MFTTITVILTILALTGVILNIKKNIACFYIWFLTNVSWSIIDFYKGIPAQGFLFLIYTGLAVYGIMEWKRVGNEPRECVLQCAIARTPGVYTNPIP